MKAWIPLRSIFTPKKLLIPLFKKIAREEDRDHAQIFSCSHLYPAVLHALHCAFPTVSISGVFSSHMKPKPHL